jgi:hypothetical protein
LPFSDVVPRLHGLPEDTRRSELENQVREIAGRLEVVPTSTLAWAIQVDRFNHDLESEVCSVASAKRSWYFDTHIEWPSLGP